MGHNGLYFYYDSKGYRQISSELPKLSQISRKNGGMVLSARYTRVTLGVKEVPHNIYLSIMMISELK